MATGKISMDAITVPGTTRAPAILRDPSPRETILETRLLTTLNAVRDCLREMSVQEKIEWARHVSAQLELHMDTFPQPPVLYGDLQGFADDLQARFNETQIGLGHWKMLASFEAHQEALVDKALTRIAQYVQGVSGGNEKLISQAGMGVRGPEKTVEAPPAPEAPETFEVPIETTRELPLKCAPPTAHEVVLAEATLAAAAAHRADHRPRRRKN